MIDLNDPECPFYPPNAVFEGKRASIEAMWQAENLACRKSYDIEIYREWLWYQYLEQNKHLWLILCRAKAIIGSDEYAPIVRILAKLRHSHIHIMCGGLL